MKALWVQAAAGALIGSVVAALALLPGRLLGPEQTTQPLGLPATTATPVVRARPVPAPHHRTVVKLVTHQAPVRVVVSVPVASLASAPVRVVRHVIHRIVPKQKQKRVHVPAARHAHPRTKAARSAPAPAQAPTAVAVGAPTPTPVQPTTSSGVLADTKTTTTPTTPSAPSAPTGASSGEDTGKGHGKSGEHGQHGHGHDK
jgi:hypothetical protein